MTPALWTAWLAILVAPWVACALATLSERYAARTLRAMGAVWCAGSLLLLAILDLPVSIAFGESSQTALPAMALGTVSWTVTSQTLWGVAVSGLAVWLTAIDDEPRAVCCLAALVCGVTAQAWFVDHAGILLTLQSLLTVLCALLVGSSARLSQRGVAFRSRWLAGAWSELVMLFAVYGGASALNVSTLTDLSNVDRLNRLAESSPGTIAQIGLLFAVAVCSGWLQFPCSGVRALSAACSPLMNVCLWHVALLPFAVRWVIAGGAWWSVDNVLSDLALQWSAVAALATAWCALASRNPQSRITWWLGVQGTLAIPVLIHNVSGVGPSVAVEHWCMAGSAACWLFGVASSPAERGLPRSWLATGLVGMAGILAMGLAVWPLTLALSPQHGWTYIMQLCVLLLAGAGAVQMTAEFRGRLSDRALWSSLGLLWAPAAAACLWGQTGLLLMQVSSASVTWLGWLAGFGGVLAAVIWRRSLPTADDNHPTLFQSLAAVGQSQFFLPALFQVGIEWPIRGAAQAARFGEWLLVDATLLQTVRTIQRGSDSRDELQSAGPEFYALAATLTTAALVMTVMWLSQ